MPSRENHTEIQSGFAETNGDNYGRDNETENEQVCNRPVVSLEIWVLSFATRAWPSFRGLHVRLKSIPAFLAFDARYHIATLFLLNHNVLAHWWRSLGDCRLVNWRGGGDSIRCSALGNSSRKLYLLNQCSNKTIESVAVWA